MLGRVNYITHVKCCNQHRLTTTNDMYFYFFWTPQMICITILTTISFKRGGSKDKLSKLSEQYPFD